MSKAELKFYSSLVICVAVISYDLLSRNSLAYIIYSIYVFFCEIPQFQSLYSKNYSCGMNVLLHFIIT